jgi:pyroglutamyl-peptidase
VSAKNTLSNHRASGQQTLKVLLTGFDAFGGDSVNPSWLAAQALQGDVIAGHTVVAGLLSTAFATSAAELKRLLRRHQPRLVICIGQAGGRSALSIERVAVNVMDARIADNLGAQPIDEPVRASGPAAYFSTLPIKAMFHAIEQAGLPAEISQTAGTFVCNQVFYELMHALKKQRGLYKARGGFVHVPYLPEQGAPNLALEKIVQGLRVAIKSALTHTTDRVLGAGSLS